MLGCVVVVVGAVVLSVVISVVVLVLCVVVVLSVEVVGISDSNGNMQTKSHEYTYTHWMNARRQCETVSTTCLLPLRYIHSATWNHITYTCIKLYSPNF